MPLSNKEELFIVRCVQAIENASDAICQLRDAIKASQPSNPEPVKRLTESDVRSIVADCLSASPAPNKGRFQPKPQSQDPDQIPRS